MARPLRVEFAGALYHVTARGNERRGIFLGNTDDDRVAFLNVLGRTCERFWNYQEWMFRRGYLFVPAQGFVGKFVKSFEDFPPRGRPASFSVGDALKKISGRGHN